MDSESRMKNREGRHGLLERVHRIATTNCAGSAEVEKREVIHKL